MQHEDVSRTRADPADRTSTDGSCVSQQDAPYEIGSNQVICAVEGRDAPFEGKARILAVSDDHHTVSMIRADTVAPVSPFLTSFDLVQAGLSQGDLQESVFDGVLVQSESQLTRRALAAVNSNFSAIEPLLINEPQILFDPEHRKEQIRIRASESGKSERTVTRSLYMYWFTGFKKLGLAGPISERESIPKEQARDTQRRGRKPTANAPAQPIWAVRTRAVKGIMEFIAGEKLDRDRAYTKTLDKYFSVGKPAAWLAGPKRISRKQFRNLIKKLEKQGIIAPVRARRARRDDNRVMQSVAVDVRGPGDRFEIDATKLQVRLVSILDRSELVKAATLYIVVDVWSGTIVGYAISLGPPCVEVAREALLNCFTDKSEVFRRLNIDLPDSPWLICKHLPKNCAVDRAELISNQAGVIPGIGIVLQIMPPYRPDLKGEVEQTFNRVKSGERIKGIPGWHEKARKRGADDGKKKAFLTLHDLEKLIVLIIQHLNAQPVPVDRLPFEALRGGPDTMSRIELYSWGLKHRAGFTRKPPSPKDVFIALLAKGTASMTAKGLRFANEFYNSPKLVELGLPQRARESTGSFDVEIKYARYGAEQIWFFEDDTCGWHPALNTDPEVIRLRCSHIELERFRRSAEEVVLKTKAQSIREDRVLDDMATSTTRVAKKLTAQARTKPRPSPGHMTEMTSMDRAAERFERADRDLARFAPPASVHVQERPEEHSPDERQRNERLAESARAVWKIRRKYAQGQS